MSNFVNINRTFDNYSEPTPFQQFKGNYATMVHTAATGMFGTVTLPVGTTPGVCRQLCESNINCEMWSFDSSRRCNLYNSTDASTITGIRINKSLRSSPVSPFSIHSNTIPRRNLVQAASSAQSLQVCEERCNVTSACALYTYSLTGSCSMYQFGLANSGNVGSSKDLLIATPQVNFQSIVLQNTSQNAGTSAKTFRVTYSNVFTGSLPYSIYDANNPSQIMFSSGTNPTSPATSTFTGIPTLGNVYVVSLGGTRFISPQRTPFYANTASSPSNITLDYTLSSNGKMYRCHIFTSGTNVVLTINGTGTIDYLVVGGGGGGAGSTINGGGGGGGGGQVIFNTTPVNLPAAGISSLTINVGAGGAGGAGGAAGAAGLNSSISGTGFTTVTAKGGTGGTVNTTTTAGKGGNSGVTSKTNTATVNNGITNILNGVGGGGGGTGSTGLASGSKGGDGTSSNFRNGNTLVFYGGGGGGGGFKTVVNGFGGSGGGGAGGTSTTAGNVGAVNTGGGGGGGGSAGTTTNRAGGAGGSGIVMIRYEIKQ